MCPYSTAAFDGKNKVLRGTVDVFQLGVHGLPISSIYIKICEVGPDL